MTSRPDIKVLSTQVPERHSRKWKAWQERMWGMDARTSKEKWAPVAGTVILWPDRPTKSDISKLKQKPGHRWVVTPA